jgi:hypothetical protein
MLHVMDGTDHAALLTRARKAHAAASDGDRPRFEREAVNLLAAFRAHVADEAEMIARLAGPVGDAVQRGQQELHEVISTLAASCEHTDLRLCMRLGSLVEAMLVVQVTREHEALPLAG